MIQAIRSAMYPLALYLNWTKKQIAAANAAAKISHWRKWGFRAGRERPNRGIEALNRLAREKGA